MITRKDFTIIVKQAFGGLGFPADAPTIVEFPMGMFMPGSDLSPINENIDKIVYGLTKWEPKINFKELARMMVDADLADLKKRHNLT